MQSKTLAVLIVVVLCILFFPALIAAMGAALGILGAVFGSFFGIFGAVIGAVFGAMGALFGAVFKVIGWFLKPFEWSWFHISGNTVAVIALVVIVVLIARSKRSAYRR